MGKHRQKGETEPLTKATYKLIQNELSTENNKT